MSGQLGRDQWHRWKVAILDLDGTLYRGEEPIAGAAEFLKELRAHHIHPTFVTNNSTRTASQVVAKLRALGLEAKPEDVFTSSMMAAAVVREQTGAGSVVAALGQEGLEEALAAEGLRPLMASQAEAVASGTGAHADPLDAVVVGLDLDLTYRRLGFICECIFRVGSWVLTNGDVRLPNGDSFLPGSGAVGRLVETTTGLPPQVVGKPNPEYLRFVLKRLGNVAAEEAVVVGDNLLTDIGAAANAGMASIHVLTGVQYSSQELANMADETPVPTYTVESVRTLGDLLRP